MRFLCNFLTATAVSNLLDSCNENLRKEFILRKYALISVSTPLTSRRCRIYPRSHPHISIRAVRIGYGRLYRPRQPATSLACLGRPPSSYRIRQRNCGPRRLGTHRYRQCCLRCWRPFRLYRRTTATCLHGKCRWAQMSKPSHRPSLILSLGTTSPRSDRTPRRRITDGNSATR